MALLNTANKLYVGSSLVSKVYAGATQVWPPATGIAFGTLLGGFGFLNTVAALTQVATGAATVKVDDLVLMLTGQQSNITVNGITDNLGNTYAFVNAGLDAGSIVGRLAYSIVTVPGNITALTVTCSAAGSYIVLNGTAFAGPFTAIDKAALPISSDITSPYTCPATGVLVAAKELVVAYALAAGATGVWSATAPMIMAQANGGTVRASLATQVVSTTASVIPEFTSTTVGNPVVLGTASFR